MTERPPGIYTIKHRTMTAWTETTPTAPGRYWGCNDLEALDRSAEVWLNRDGEWWPLGEYRPASEFELPRYWWPVPLTPPAEET